MLPGGKTNNEVNWEKSRNHIYSNIPDPDRRSLFENIKEETTAGYLLVKLVESYLNIPFKIKRTSNLKKKIVKYILIWIAIKQFVCCSFSAHWTEGGLLNMWSSVLAHYKSSSISWGSCSSSSDQLRACFPKDEHSKHVSKMYYWSRIDC